MDNRIYISTCIITCTYINSCIVVPASVYERDLEVILFAYIHKMILHKMRLIMMLIIAPINETIYTYGLILYSSLLVNYAYYYEDSA